MLMDRLNSGADFAQLRWTIRGYEFGGNGRRPGLFAGVGAESIRPALKKMFWLEAVSKPPIQLKEGYRILKLITRESPGLPVSAIPSATDDSRHAAEPERTTLKAPTCDRAR